LAKKRGVFPNFNKSIWKNKLRLRNATLTTLAPTGTISIIADTSAGIEPLFGLKFKRMTTYGTLKEKRKIKIHTAHDISPEFHVRMQATFQKYTDNAISKTVNLKQNATIDDIKKIFILAYKLKCKGLTIYRYSSRKEQVLSF